MTNGIRCNRSIFYSLATTLSLALGIPAQAGFIPLGDLPSTYPNNVNSIANGVSADGSAVVGQSTSDFQEAFRWTQDDGMIGLGDLLGGFNKSIANGVSAGGDVVVGTGSNASSADRPFRWTAGGGMVDLGKLAGGNGHCRAWGVSADGNVVVGESGSTYAGLGKLEAFRWTQAGGMVGLGALNDADRNSNARAVSADGGVVVGGSLIVGGALRAFRWTQAGGMVDIGALPGFASSTALGVSSDGSVVVGGNVSSFGTQQGFRWTQAGGMVGLGDLPGSTVFSVARGVSADGNRIVGLSNGTNSTLGNAFIWDPVNGMRDLKDVLIGDYGIAIPSGWLLRDATAISPDGRFIVGYGRNPNLQSEAWLVDLGPIVPEPGTLALLSMGALGMAFWAIRRGCQSRKSLFQHGSAGIRPAANKVI
jgi:probable HAF family extracellular repeat protein